MNDRTCDESEPWISDHARAYPAYVARARRPQSEAIGSAVASAGRFLAHVAVETARRIASEIRKRQTIAELSRLEDHLLADIGIERAQIPMVAEGLIAPSGEMPRRIVSTTECPSEHQGVSANDPRHGSVAA